MRYVPLVVWVIYWTYIAIQHLYTWDTDGKAMCHFEMFLCITIGISFIAFHRQRKRKPVKPVCIHGCDSDYCPVCCH